jgi:hypothetical protein
MLQAVDDTVSRSFGSTAPGQVAGALDRQNADDVASGGNSAVEGIPYRVALLCAQQRLRTVLRLALQAADYEVVEWHHLTAPSDRFVAAVVVDLDSLGKDVSSALSLLDTWCVDESTSLLFISVYPLDLRSLQRAGPCDELQPPFSPIVLIDRVRHLLRRATLRLVPRSGSGQPGIMDSSGAISPGEP